MTQKEEQEIRKCAEVFVVGDPNILYDRFLNTEVDQVLYGTGLFPESYWRVTEDLWIERNSCTGKFDDSHCNIFTHEELEKKLNPKNTDKPNETL